MQRTLTSIMLFTLIFGVSNVHPIPKKGNKLQLDSNFVADNPSWSPSGNEIALNIFSSGFSDIFILTIEQPTLTNITNSPKSNEVFPQWSPDGKWISFISDMSGEYDLWIISTDGSNSRNVTSDINETVLSLVDWSSDGNLMAFSTFTSTSSSVWIFDLTTLKTSELLSDVVYDKALPSWSYNDSQIVIIGQDDEGQGVWIVTNISNGDFSLLLRGNYSSAVWSPVSDTIAILIPCERGFNIATIDTNTKKSTVVTKEPCSASVVPPTWSPNGKFLAYMYVPENEISNEIQVGIIDIETQENYELTSILNGEALNPTWSPDNNYVAFAFYKNGKQDIWIIDKKGENPVNITESYRI